MQTDDFPEFCELLDTLALLLPPRQPLTPTAKAMYFRAVQELDIEQFREALDAHTRDRQRGRFFPLPADVLAAADGSAANDGRPTADEAWAIASAAMDEGATVVWTAEMAQAWGACLPALEPRNTNPMRMAFRDTYNRLVDEARQQRAPLQWLVSEGHDTERRRTAVDAALAAGRLTHEQAAPLLGLPLRTEAVALLAGPEGEKGVPAHVMERLQQLRAHLTSPRDLGERNAVEAQRLAAAKAEAKRLVAACTAQE